MTGTTGAPATSSANTAAANKPRVLCVDDEPAVLEGISMNLRRRYTVETAPGGAAALEILGRDATIAVIVSDMRMPGMDGAAFLTRAREIAPQAVRILLTGQAELASAIAAVNEGQIFRFLSKPCPPPMLLATIDAAAEQHRLLTSERVLLEQTLHGSIKALTDVLALTNPACFGRANRIKQIAGELAERLKLPDGWQIEMAAMLSQLGCIILPAKTIEKLFLAEPLSEEEQGMVARLPVVTEQLLGSIPRLENVRAILALQGKTFPQLVAARTEPRIARGAQLLTVAADFDALEMQGMTPRLAIGTLRGRGNQYDSEVVDALAMQRGRDGQLTEVRELSLSELRVGMVLAEDVRMKNGNLIITRGFEVTPGFLERLRNFGSSGVKEPIRVVLKRVGQA